MKFAEASVALDGNMPVDGFFVRNWELDYRRCRRAVVVSDRGYWNDDGDAGYGTG